MHSNLEDWKNGWFGVQLGLKRDEIDRVIELLRMLNEEPEQHFHLSSDYKGRGGLGDIEFFIQPDDQPSNMETLRKALGPGEHIARSSHEHAAAGREEEKARGSGGRWLSSR